MLKNACRLIQGDTFNSEVINLINESDYSKKQFVNNNKKKEKSPLLLIKSESSNNKSLPIKMRKEPFFYGSTGILSFCQELFSLSENTKNTLDFFDDISTLLIKLHKSIAIQSEKCSQSVCYGNNDFTLDSPSESPTLGALIDPKNSLTLNSSKNSDCSCITFEPLISPQFHTFCAIYFSKYQPQSMQIAKVFMNNNL